MRYRPIASPPGEWDTVNPSATATRHVVAGLTNDTEYEFEIFGTGRTHDVDSITLAAKVGSIARIEATPEAGVSGPPPPDLHFSEVIGTPAGWDRAIARYEKSGSTNWFLTGDDRLLLNLKGEGGYRNLHFNNPPDFENPVDANGDNFYNVTINALPNPRNSEWSTDPFTKSVSVEVQNMPEIGKVSFSTSSPAAGESITATLSDPDNVVVSEPEPIIWKWYRALAAYGTYIEEGTLVREFTSALTNSDTY